MSTEHDLQSQAALETRFWFPLEGLYSIPAFSSLQRGCCRVTFMVSGDDFRQLLTHTGRLHVAQSSRTRHTMTLTLLFFLGQGMYCALLCLERQSVGFYHAD